MIVRGIALIALGLTMAVSGQAHAGKAAPSPMEQCAAQWHDLRAANATGAQDYRTFTAGCLKAGRAVSAAPSLAPSGDSKTFPKTKMVKTGMPKTKMGRCAAQWRGMKAANTTDGMTYRQWTSKCMKKAGA